MFVVLGLSLFISTSKVLAAEAQCATFDGNKAEACSKSALKSYPIQGGGSFKAGHCYRISGSSSNPNQLTWKVQPDCSQLPFNTNIQSVRCADNDIHSGPQTLNGAAVSFDEICAEYGGVHAGTTSSTTNLQQDCDDPSGEVTAENCNIVKWLVILTRAISGLVGIVIVISIIAAGIQWSTAGNNPQQVAAAKSRIFNALLALFVFIFMFAFLQWIVPGGIL